MGVMTAREFYLNKSSVLGRVEAGETIQITNRGRPVARIEPEDPQFRRPEPGTPEWQAAYDRMVDLMDRGYHLGSGRVSYEDRTE